MKQTRTVKPPQPPPTSGWRSMFDITSTRFKTVATGLVILYLLGIFTFALSRFTTTDTVPPLKPINTQALKTLGNFTVRVKTGLFIKNFPVFDVTRNTFQVDAILWFAFNADDINLETVERFSIDNGKILYRSTPDIKVEGANIFAKYNVVFELKSDLTFNRFPFEDHRLPILISNDFVTPEEMIYTVDGSSFQILSKVAPAGWNFQDLNVDAGYMPITLDKQDVNKKAENPKALFILNFVKASSRKALVIFTPLFSMAFFGLFAFIMNMGNTTGKVIQATTALTALLGYRFVIEQMMPQVGYFTTTDNIYLFLLAFAFFNFIIQLLITRVFMVTDNKDEAFMQRLEKISSIIFIIMLLLLVVVTTYFILV